MTLTAVARLFRRSPPRLAPSAAYALWAESYPPAPHNALMRAEQAVMAPMIAASRPSQALDVGTGTGRYVEVLARARARRIVAVDLSMAMLLRHTGRASRICGNALGLPFRDRSFDLITSSLMVGDVEDLDAWIGEMARLLVPGGHLIYSDFHPQWATRRWRRTFRTPDGRAFQLPYHPHALDAHLSALDRRSFDLRTVREPRLQPADAADVNPRRRMAPVVVAFDAIKRPSRR